MSLDPHANRLCRMLAAAMPRDAMRRVDIEERRRAFRDLMRLSAFEVTVGKVEDATVPGPDSLIPIRIYSPAGAADGLVPGLVYFHGGGFVSGSLDTHDTVCRMLTNETGCRTIAVAYRLAPENRFPSALQDGVACLEWVASHASALGIDERRLGVAGDSAGGTIAAVLCQVLRAAHRPRLAFQLLLCPIVDLGGDAESRRIFAGPLLDEATLARDLAWYLPAGTSPGDPRVSPCAAPTSGICRGPSFIPRNATLCATRVDPMRMP
jgi:acetyl esterase/lipase